MQPLECGAVGFARAPPMRARTKPETILGADVAVSAAFGEMLVYRLMPLEFIGDGGGLSALTEVPGLVRFARRATG